MDDLNRCTPVWKNTGDAKFPLAAEVEGSWWVLRMNSFPDHSLWTLFVDGVAWYDLDEEPSHWGRLPPAGSPCLAPEVGQHALARVRGLEIYGSEVGRPCDGLFCCGDPSWP